MNDIDLKDVKKGDKFYECEMGMNARCEAQEDCREVDEPELLRKGYACKVAVQWLKKDGSLSEPEVTEYFECYEPGAYGLRLYSSPQYTENYGC